MLFFIFSVAFCDFDENFDEDFESEYKKEKIFDPLIGYNKIVTNFNDFVYVYAFTPFAKGYDKVMPDLLQEGVSNIFYNLKYPIRFVNNILQGKFAKAGSETGRFLLNSTIGFAGFFDIASEIKIKKYDEDFGQTLGFWGIKSGFPVTLPILGQSNLRDIFGSTGDYYFNPNNHFNDPWWLSTTLNLYNNLNEFSKDPDAYVNFTRDSIDLYSLIRDAYEQRREFLIKE